MAFSVGGVCEPEGMTIMMRSSGEHGGSAERLTEANGLWAFAQGNV
jgi:hypothetical protein